MIKPVAQTAHTGWTEAMAIPTKTPVEIRIKATLAPEGTGRYEIEGDLWTQMIAEVGEIVAQEKYQYLDATVSYDHRGP